MNSYDDTKKATNAEQLTPEQVDQRRKDVHQRIEELNEERRLKRQLSDEWDD